MANAFARPARLALTTDLENNGETFWTAFRALDNNHPALVRWPGLRKLQGGADRVEIDASDTDTVEALPAFLAEIDGWDDGDERAPHPVIVQVECDEDEDGE